MFETKTYEAIMEEMLGNVPSDVDKREGSVIYDALAPIAFEIAQMYSDLDELIDETFVDTASYYYLVKRAAERGIIVNDGTPAVIEVVVDPIDYTLDISTGIIVEDTNFYISSQLSDDGHYLATCYENGEDYNFKEGTAVPAEYLEGLNSIEIFGLYQAGTNPESEESLRERYIESFNISAFGGNKADYIKNVKAISGVQGCKVYSAQDLQDSGEKNAAGKVKCVISSYEGVASEELIKNVQEEMDPTGTGTGDGVAPIGHIVNIKSVSSEIVNITATFDLKCAWEDVSEQIKDVVNAYLNELITQWDSLEYIVIRRSQLQTRILENVENVIDIDNVKINDIASNYKCDKDGIPQLGGITNG